MTASIKITLLGTACAFALGAFLGGASGVALSTGFVLGSAAALAIGAGQRALARGRPELVLHLVGAGFVAKVFVLLAVILAVRFAGITTGSFDGRTFALAFAGAVLLLVPAATIDLVKLCMPVTSAPAASTPATSSLTTSACAPGAQPQGTLP